MCARPVQGSGRVLGALWGSLGGTSLGGRWRPLGGPLRKVCEGLWGRSAKAVGRAVGKGLCRSLEGLWGSLGVFWGPLGVFGGSTAFTSMAVW
eukprot:366323-Chlamydomonas_euryale.AAC.3